MEVAVWLLASAAFLWSDHHLLQVARWGSTLSQEQVLRPEELLEPRLSSVLVVKAEQEVARQLSGAPGRKVRATVAAALVAMAVRSRD